MRRRSLAFTSLAMAAMAMSGCGEDPGVQQGTVPFKGSNTAPLDPLSGQMKKKMQDKSYANKGEESDKPASDSKPATDSKPGGESKPADDSKPTTDSKPTGDSKPAGDSKSATKGG